MPQTVSQSFITAAQADSNRPSAKVQLVLGNYASAPAYGTTVIGSGDISADYPAAGAIDGDRTEINVGPASGADNNVGKSSWRSSGIPNNGDNVYLQVVFTQNRTFNRIKIYHLNGHGLKTYTLQYWTGSSWFTFAATNDVALAGQTSIVTSGQLDVVDFPDITSTQIRIVITATRVAGDNANVVEFEVYRKIDITARVKSIEVRRARDYKLGNPLASTVTLTCTNGDRFFSVSHTPTVSEVTDGFVNSELAPEIGVIVSQGFDYGVGGPELVTTFIGTVDRIGARPKSRDAVIEGRDGMKALINRTDSTKLKTSKPLDSNLRYMLNRANFSDYEMTLDTTPFNIDYFFSDRQNVLTTIQGLVQAAVDALFFFNENGAAVFKYYSSVVPIQHVYTTQNDFEAGTLSVISTRDGTDSLKVPVKFAPLISDGTFTGDAFNSSQRIRLNGWSRETAAGTGTRVAPNVPSGGVRAIGVRVKPLRSGNVTFVYFDTTFSLSGGGGPPTDPRTVTFRVSLWSDNAGAPNAILASTLINRQYSGNGTYTLAGIDMDAAAVTAGTNYWIAIEFVSVTPSVTFVFNDMQTAASNWSGVRRANGVFTANSLGVWEDLTTNVNPSGYYDVSNTVSTGTWTSPVYDSFSLAVGSSLTMSFNGTLDPSSYTVFVDGGNDGSVWLETYSQAGPPPGTFVKAVTNRRYWRIRVSLTTTNFIVEPGEVSSPSIYFATSGTWTSPVLDTGAGTIAFGKLAAAFILNGGSVIFYTRSSDDGVSFDPWAAIAANGQISSAVRRYLQIRADIFLSSNLLSTPQILDLTANWTGAAGSQKYPPAASIAFGYDSTLLDLGQELADNVGGDSSILNDVSVQAQPLIISGADTDTVWQGSQGTPPLAISASAPLGVTTGQVITVNAVVAGGMDIARMSGANPAAAVVTFAGGATGNWSFTNIHPTLPALAINITNGGQITDLRIVGKKFVNAGYLQVQNVTNAASVAKYGHRQLNVSNPWIISASLANTIAQKLSDNYNTPLAYISSCVVRPTFHLQAGDRVTVADVNLDLSADYIVAGLTHRMAVQPSSAEADTTLTLIKMAA